MSLAVRSIVIALGVAFLFSGCKSISVGTLKADAQALEESPVPASIDDFRNASAAYRSLVDRQEQLVREAECRALRRGDRKPWHCMNAIERALSEMRQRRAMRQRPSLVGQQDFADFGEEAKTLDLITVTGSRIDAADVVTNNQEPGADEGGLVKKAGSFLFVLEDANLHAVRIERDGLPVMQHVSSIALDEKPFDLDSTWYDELLVAGDKILVLGFNYREDVAELHSFSFTPDGRLRRAAKIWIRSGDYFSSSGYASRIVGDRLVTRLSAAIDADSMSWDWPEWSRRDVPNPAWQPIVEPSELTYVPGAFSERMAIHVVLRCDLAAVSIGSLACDRRAIVGPEAAVFYVSANAAYLGMYHLGLEGFGRESFLPDSGYAYGSGAADVPHRTTIAKIPLDSSSPVGLARIEGQVLDSMSFAERPSGLFVKTTRVRYAAVGDDFRRIDQPLLNRLRPVDWGSAPTSPSPPYAQFPILSDGREAQVRFSRDACWLAALGGSIDESGDYTRYFLHRVSLDDATYSAVEVGSAPDILQPIDGRLLLVGEDVNGQLAASLVDDSVAISQSSALRWPRQGLGETRSQALNLRRRADGAWLIAWPSVAWLPKGLPDYWERRDQEISNLQFVAMEAGLLRDVGVIGMQEIARNGDPDHIAWYGDARVAFVGERAFVFSRNLVKEASFDGHRMSVQRVVDLSSPAPPN